MCVSIDLAANRLLDSLSPGAWQRLLPSFERVELKPGQVLHESGSPMPHVYFPLTATVSLLYETANGASVELAMVGNDGVVGIELFLGGSSVPHRAVVCTEGRGYRVPAPAVRQEFERAGSTMHLMLLYASAMINQIAQTAVCNRHHSLKQRLCRWLLSILDRLEGTELTVTHERIAHILGVRREGVTEAARELQRDGVIDCLRGRILVLDRPGLEQRSCECYAVVRNEYERLLPARRHAWPRPSPSGL